ncbi:MAG: preprotein translocase subunit SecG [Pseudorhodoplanes sp.]|nr:preprotein translocase subunit SecG [Pseudorhodoplanes sp.]
MQTVLIVVHLMIVLTMVGLVLLQRSEGGGLGMGGGGGFMTSRGTSNVLSRSTAILAAAFFATSIILSILAGMDRAPTSIVVPSAPSGPQAPTSLPQAPLGGPGGGVLDTLRQREQQAPAAPSGPQVPRSQ